MKKNIFKNLICFSVLVFLCFNIFVPFVNASIFDKVFENLNIFTAEAELPGGGGVDLGDIIISIINVILGLLGLMFVIMIIAGGFKYMTAGGNAENTKKATDIIRNAVIGIAIVLLSGAIMNFVFANIIRAVTENI